MKKTEGYKCDFCGKMSSSKGAMTVHERACRHNPENRSMCAACEHLKRFEDFEYNSDGEPVKKTELICARTGDRLYHNRVLRFVNKDAAGQIISHADRKMPNIKEGCEFFKEYDPNLNRI